MCLKRKMTFQYFKFPHQPVDLTFHSLSRRSSCAAWVHVISQRLMAWFWPCPAHPARWISQTSKVKQEQASVRRVSGTVVGPRG